MPLPDEPLQQKYCFNDQSFRSASLQYLITSTLFHPFFAFLSSASFNTTPLARFFPSSSFDFAAIASLKVVLQFDLLVRFMRRLVSSSTLTVTVAVSAGSELLYMNVVFYYG